MKNFVSKPVGMTMVSLIVLTSMLFGATAQAITKRSIHAPPCNSLLFDGEHLLEEYFCSFMSDTTLFGKNVTKLKVDFSTSSSFDVTLRACKISVVDNMATCGTPVTAFSRGYTTASIPDGFSTLNATESDYFFVDVFHMHDPSNQPARQITIIGVRGTT